MEVHCWDCPEIYDVASDMEGKAYNQGLIRRRNPGDSDSDWMGLCAQHRVMHARAADPTAVLPFGTRSPRLLLDETREILLCARELRENDLGLGRDEAIHRAVETIYAPERERHLAFREFLLQRRQQAKENP